VFYDAESDFFDGLLGKNSLVYISNGMLLRLCPAGEMASRTI